MSKHDGFDVVEVELSRMARVTLDTAMELSDAALDFYPAGSPVLGAFGNLLACLDVGSALGRVTGAANIAMSCFVHVLEDDSEKLCRTAVNYQAAEHQSKSFMDKVWDRIPG